VDHGPGEPSRSFPWGGKKGYKLRGQGKVEKRGISGFAFSREETGGRRPGEQRLVHLFFRRGRGAGIRLRGAGLEKKKKSNSCFYFSDRRGATGEQNKSDEETETEYRRKKFPLTPEN